MKQQDLIWVKLPFSNLEEGKVRPAVIVSNNSYNNQGQDVIVCAVTSKLDEKRFSIAIDNASLSTGNIPLKSRIRADKIMQIEKNLIIKSFAHLNDKAFDSLTNEISKLVKRD